MEEKYKVEQVSGNKSAQEAINKYVGRGWVLDHLAVDRREGLGDTDWFYIVLKRGGSDGEEPQDLKWFWKTEDDDDWRGPVDWENLVEMVKNGKVEENSIVWQKNYDRWRRVDSVPKLDNRLPSSTPDPPPIPDRVHTGRGIDEIKLSESEALGCIHDYDEDEQGREYCTKCGWYRHSLQSINS
ncbi:Ca2+-binding EF-hand superfamily protein [Salinibacter ruber]|uniref:DUF4339 domain-containing protein n=1 Tax=Salinibacter ruber TaxID=146919 RepID=UPI002168D2BA|nr:DUF4339 domain-containing protein [Salinibacter ruber]MCS3635961.1 Ca2+-binding EF-hand superfamily protein [Salinibacter ruber]MCS3715480.1 Ca2+-binding EF-hand superfamily protein [Salinibacter ruber]